MRQLYYLLTIAFGAVSTFHNLNAQDLIPSQQPHLSGYWKFQDPNNLTRGTVGKDLKLIGTHQWIKGPEQKDTAVRIGPGSYYKCIHGVSPNGGDSVNRYTLMFDFKVENLDRWHTFFQTDTNNLNDGECFIRPNSQSNPGRIGTATTGYTPVAINTKQWYRLVVSVNLGSYYRYYLNGQLILEGNNQDTDDRFALNPYFLLFADNDLEDDTIDIASVAIFDTCLNSNQVAALGTVDPCLLHPMSLSLGVDTSLCGNAGLTKSLKQGYSYKWSTGDTGYSLTFNVSKMGLGSKSIWVEMKDINSCVKRDTFNLSIFTSPTVNLGKDTAFCKGPSYRLVAGPATGNTFEWRHLPSGNIVSKINSMTTDSSGLYTVKMTNANACSAYDSVLITIHPIPAKPTIVYNALELCDGDTFKVNGPANYAVYEWSAGYYTESFQSTSGFGTRLRVKSQFGCVSPWSDSLDFKINALPATPQIQYSPDTVFCDGDSILLYLSQTYKAVKWQDGYDKPARQVKNSNQFQVIVTDFNDCKSQWSGIVSTKVLERPSDPVISEPIVTDYCNGESVKVVCQTNADNVLWSNTEDSTTIWIANSGQYIVSASNDNGCNSYLQDTIELTFHPKPIKPIIEFHADSLFLVSSTIGDYYEWKHKGVALTDTLRIFSLKNNHLSGKFSLRVREGICWSDRTDTMIDILYSVNRLKAQALAIYPNPVSGTDKLTIDNSVDLMGSELIIVDINGSIVLKGELEENSIDISGLSQGIYTVLIRNGDVLYSAIVSKVGG